MKTALIHKAGVYETEILNTLSNYFEAHKFVVNNRFYKYLLFSGISFLLLFTIVLKGVLYGIDYFKIPIENLLLPILIQYFKLSTVELQKGVDATFWLIKKGIETNKDAIFSFAFMILGTPYLSFISKSVNEIITLEKEKFQLKTLLKDILRGIRISIRTSFKQFVLILIITLISFIPIIEIITPLLVFVVQAYYNGILLTDYSLEREGYSIAKSNTYYQENKPQMFAIGLGFMFLLMIPVVGWFLAPTYGIVTSSLVVIVQKDLPSKALNNKRD